MKALMEEQRDIMMEQKEFLKTMVFLERSKVDSKKIKQ
jgi:hypothetical protein